MPRELPVTPFLAHPDTAVGSVHVGYANFALNSQVRLLRLASVEISSWENSMSKLFSGLVVVSLVIASNAQAAGCTKGAVVGGVAGHVAGKHGVAGAAGGCAVGHHEAAKKAKAASGASAG